MRRTPKAMVVAGVMSGTSADGVDVALVRIAPGTGTLPKITSLGHREFRYPRVLRDAVLRVMEGVPMSAAAMSQLNWRLGSVYAECVAETQRTLGMEAALVGLHGQTVYHQALAKRAFGGRVRATWQIGEAAVIREQLGVPVVSGFRQADFAAGGQGAPLVPMLDFCMFRSETVGRVLLNLGGIANITTIPASASIEEVIAFDTGPANMVIDALMMRFFRKPFDEGGQTAARGRVLAPVLRSAMRNRYFGKPAPKSCGREQFGTAFAERFAAACERAAGAPEDALATATKLTVETIAEAVLRSCTGRSAGSTIELIAAGGGTRNQSLMQGLRARLSAAGIGVSTVDALGVDAQAKEAVAFALLAWLSWHGLPGNVRSASGASGARVLGTMTC